MTSTSYPLDDALELLQHLWELNHALEKLSSRMEKSSGVSAQQRFVIRCLGKYPGITAGQLAQVLHLDPGTISATLRRLERKKLITRRRDPRDARRVRLGLTDKGRAVDRPSPRTAEHAVVRLIRTANPDHLAAAKSVLSSLTLFLADEASMPADRA